jgi:hypothetical protein
MLPDICLGTGSKAEASAIGAGDGAAGGIGAGTVGGDGNLTYQGKVGDKPCSRPVIDAVAGSPKTLTIQICQTNGDAVDLSSFSEVRFKVKESYDARTLYIDTACSIVDATNGMIRLDLSKALNRWAGVWLAAFVLENADGDSVAQYDCYLHVSKGIANQEYKNSSITIADVRLALWDRCVTDNGLLDDFEFSDSEICSAIRMPVDEWNETPPIINGAQFTAATFPYRYNWIQAAAAELLRMAARNLLRNKLDYNAGGLNVNDRSRGPIYVQLATAMRQEWRDWMMREKRRINAENCYGGVSSRIYY